MEKNKRSPERIDVEQLTPEDNGNRPAPRCHHTLVSDPENESILMFGGFSFSGRFNDVWRYDPAETRWIELQPTGAAPARRGARPSDTSSDSTSHPPLGTARPTDWKSCSPVPIAAA